MSFDDKAERRHCVTAMLETGIDEWSLNQWDIGFAESVKLDSFLEGWLARAKRQPHIPVFAIRAATDALQVFLDSIDKEMAESAVKSCLLANDRVNVAQQVSTLRAFLEMTHDNRR